MAVAVTTLGHDTRVVAMGHDASDSSSHRQGHALHTPLVSSCAVHCAEVVFACVVVAMACVQPQVMTPSCWVRVPAVLLCGRAIAVHVRQTSLMRARCHALMPSHAPSRLSANAGLLVINNLVNTIFGVNQH